MPQIDFPSDTIALMTVFALSQLDQSDRLWLRDLVINWGLNDDVYRPEFLRNLIFISSEQRADIRNLYNKLRRDWDTEWLTTIQMDDDVEGLTSGPYVMWKGQLCKAFRLYDDVQQAFIVATRPKTTKEYAHS